ncbi:glycosyltransferase family 2 protein [Salipiger sp. PrR002]|uniref:glycosyltransferase n=1 Tax=Salipiger sp. PrR002 TaxID=2706489 RepID=UPI0013B84AC2|nr:glycosyltransferase family 2 protein [Salipiger sp. PrR002]NDW01737.1 glycosyltransferase [Salipiger sp. PrR002]NDW57826.1 glycosyltransferase [Salipiger sp. PrR004]
MTKRIDLCICTFRRPALADTLRSLRDVVVPEGYELCVFIADNDDEPSAKPITTEIPLPFQVTYQHVPARNISVARNAGLAYAQGDFVAFIDDDETVSPGWLAELLATAAESSADVVFGPAVSIYPAQTPAWMVEGDFHSTKPPAPGVKITTGCSANVLIRRSAPGLDRLRFDIALGRAGGEDTVFFAQLHAFGARMTFAPKALVYEKVDPRRLSLGWLLQRRLRAGQSTARAAIVTSERPASTRVRVLALSTCKAFLCGASALLRVADQRRRNYWLIRGALHLGAAGRCLGVREQEHYGGIQVKAADPARQSSRHPIARQP